MSAIASTASAKTDRTRGKRQTFLSVLRDQGRSYVWLARQTGYSADHLSRVANGEHPGTTKFWKLVSIALGEELTR